MATMAASVFASVIIFMVPIGSSAFLPKPKAGYEQEFAEIMVADSKNVCFSINSLRKAIVRRRIHLDRGTGNGYALNNSRAAWWT